MRGFYIRGPFGTIARFDAAVAFFADLLRRLGHDDPEDVRRVKAVLILSDPAAAVELMESGKDVDWSQFLPAVTVHVHLYGGAENTGVARVEGVGPLTEAWVREHLGRDAKVTIRPVLDIEGQAPVDAYEIPYRHHRPCI